MRKEAKWEQGLLATFQFVLEQPYLVDWAPSHLNSTMWIADNTCAAVGSHLQAPGCQTVYISEQCLNVTSKPALIESRHKAQLTSHSKVTLLTLAVSLSVITIAMYFLLERHYSEARRNRIESLYGISAMTEYNVETALAFDDPDVAKKTLEALIFKKGINWAAIYDKNSKLVASYRLSDPEVTKAPNIPLTTLRDALILSRDIEMDGQFLGKLVISGTTKDIHRDYTSDLLFTATMLAVSALIAAVLSLFLQRIVTEPIRRLIDAINQIAQNKDYSSRVEVADDQEFAALINRFNAMLGEIQLRDRTLEENVSRRTDTIKASNELLNMLIEGKPLDSILTCAIDHIERRLAGATASVMLASSDQSSLHFHLGPRINKNYAAKLTSIPIKDNTGSCGTSAARREPIVCEDVINDPRWKDYTMLALEAGFRACWSIPLIAGNKTLLGTFAIYYDTVRSPTLGELEETIDFSRLIGVVIEHFSSIEDLKRAKDAAETANAAKSQFLANVSHELRTPMNGVLGMTELLLDSELTDDQRSLATTVHICGTSLLGLLNDILDCSKIEFGKLSLTPTPFALKSIEQEVLDLFAVKIGERKIHLRVEYDSRLPEQVVGDKDRLRQVLINLISNSLKFTESGGVVILYVLCRHKTSKSARIKFAVADTGIGIPQEKQQSIFVAFEQADPSHTRRYGGTGLGLSISQHLVELMGGELQVWSKVGIGSVFSFELDLPVSAVQLTEQNRLTCEKDDFSDAKALKILLAEDNEVNQKLAYRLLTKLGHDVSVVSNGKEAVDAYTAKPFDVILMDIQMPVLDGLNAMKTIRSMEAANGNHIPIVALTAHAMTGDREKYLSEGMDGYVSKPIRLQDLKNTLNQFKSK